MNKCKSFFRKSGKRPPQTRKVMRNVLTKLRLNSIAADNLPDRVSLAGIGMEPVCSNWGFSRGKPIDRYYIEEFLQSHADNICGQVLEVGDNAYTFRFGGERVTKSNVLDLTKSSDKVTIVADLTGAPHVPSDTFDCIILTQVLVLIQDVQNALATVCRILKPGGVVLITVPGISQISSSPIEANEWSWSFYPKTMRWLLLQHGFEEGNLLVQGAGNLKSTIGFLLGLAQKDLPESDLAFRDERYPLVVTARAIKKREFIAAGSQ